MYELGNSCLLIGIGKAPFNIFLVNNQWLSHFHFFRALIFKLADLDFCPKCICKELFCPLYTLSHFLATSAALIVWFMRLAEDFVGLSENLKNCSFHA